VLCIQEREYTSYTSQLNNLSNWSVNIANFLENNDNSSAVDFASFQKLTGQEILPNVDANAALVLLKEEQKYVSPDVHINVDNNDGEQEESSLLTNLQNRCLEILVEANLELKVKQELRERATKVVTLLPRVMGMYLDTTLILYGQEKANLIVVCMYF